MSHLTTPKPNSIDDPDIIEYSEADRKVRRLYIQTQTVSYIATAAMVWLMVMSYARADWLSLLATLVLAATSLPFFAKAGEIHHDYQPVKARRKYTRQAFRFARKLLSVKNMNWSPRASYTLDIEMFNQSERVIELIIRHRDAMMVSHVYEISPTRVYTVRGPRFETIFADLVLMSEQSDDFGQSDSRMGATFTVNLRDQLEDATDVNGHEPLTQP